MDIKRMGAKFNEDETTLGVYVWDREVRSYGIYEGGPKFLMGKRKINDEEFEEQQTRLKWGLTPDPLDIGEYKDQMKALKNGGTR